MKKAFKVFALVLAGLAFLVYLIFGYHDRSVEDLLARYGQPPSAFLQIEDMRVHYREEGNPLDSLPIVLIHGTGSSLHTFDAWADALQKHRRVVRMDLPAFGLTGPFPDRDYSMEHYVRFLEEFLAARDIGRCVLAGNSLGGLIAWRTALKRPELVERLILINAAGYPKKSVSEPLAFTVARIPVLNRIMTLITPRFIVKASVENVYADKRKVTKALVERYFQLSLREGNRQALVDRMQVAFDTAFIDQIRTIRQPTLVLWGEADSLITTESAYRFHRDLPNDTLVILENSGHVPMEENPSESLEVVWQFLEHYPSADGSP